MTLVTRQKKMGRQSWSATEGKWAGGRSRTAAEGARLHRKAGLNY
jgi:hypothetical protein